MKLIYTTTTNPIQYILPKHNNFGFRKQQIAMTQQFLSWRTYSTGNCEGFCEIIFVPMSKKMKNWLNYIVRQTSQVFKLTKIWVHTCFWPSLRYSEIFYFLSKPFLSYQFKTCCNSQRDFFTSLAFVIWLLSASQVVLFMCHVGDTPYFFF